MAKGKIFVNFICALSLHYNSIKISIKMRKLFILMLLPIFVSAHEGMWLPHLIKQLNYAEMQSLGLQLTPEQLYSVNNSSLKDAIVSFGGFCTGEIISERGLVLTNHHCGYDAIRSHSTVENDILTNGFWAKNLSEEKVNPNLFVSFLIRIEDVTGDVLKEITPGMSEDDRAAKIREVATELQKKAVEGTHYVAQVKEYFNGNEYYLLVYEIFNDVRLVGAPPSSVGKYGGDTDNWMWPRHTGDFSMFRVYSGKDGKPAAHSNENIPLKPRHFLPVSLDGVKEGDFTMIFGYPGSTDRFLSSAGVKQAIEKVGPSVVTVRELKLAILRKHMNASDAVRLAYASNYARTANYWKYFIGQTKQLKNNRVFDKKKEIENAFVKWAAASPDRTEKYGNAVNDLNETYKVKDDYAAAEMYAREALLIGADVFLYSFRNSNLLKEYTSLIAANKKLKSGEEFEKNAQKIERLRKNIEANAERHYSTYYHHVDQELAGNLLALYAKDVDPKYHPAFFAMVNKKYKGDYNRFVAEVFKKSIMTDKNRLMAYLNKPNQKVLDKDLGLIAATDIYNIYSGIPTQNKANEDRQEAAYRSFVAGLREMNTAKKYYPNANSTMRMTYGQVGSYKPADAVKYHYLTYAEGILQKEDPQNPEFIVPEKLSDLIRKKDFGLYADENGKLPVNLISGNDITGGNSGSPLINAKGELIGCAFDGNWEAMSGDIFFEDNLQRTISVDSRYILFIVDKLADAGHLLDEMKLMKNGVQVKRDGKAVEAAPSMN